jgi:hypothetical protein
VRRLIALALGLVLTVAGCATEPRTRALPRPSSTVVRPTTTTTLVAPELVAVMDGAGMTPLGRDLFLDAAPQLEDAATLSRTCAVVEAPDRQGTAHTFGCFVNGIIHVRTFSAPEVSSLTYAVAAHELLHVVYTTLRSGERARLDADLAAARTVTPEIEERLEVYSVRSEDTLNEVHSVLGTEFGDLSPALEAHYAKYIDRAKVLSAYRRALGDREEQIRVLKAKIEETELRLAQLNAELSVLREADDIRGYNARVAVYNAVVAEHNGAVDRVKAQIAEYNRLTAA